MANYFVTSSDLTNVANAIRAKGEITNNLTFPTGFILAVNNISKGMDLMVIADEYDSTTTYPTVGTYCTHNGALYKSNIAINTAEAWNSSHWTETQVMDEIIGTTILPAAGRYF